MQKIEYGGQGILAFKEFSKFQLTSVSISKPEGNRYFEIILRNVAGIQLYVTSTMYNLGNSDEIPRMNFDISTDSRTELVFTDVTKATNNLGTFYKIVGNTGDEEVDCGLICEYRDDSLIMMCGSFPCSMHIILPGFSNRLIVNNLPKFRFKVERL